MRYAVVFDDSDLFGDIVPISCDMGYKDAVGIRRLEFESRIQIESYDKNGQA